MVYVDVLWFSRYISTTIQWGGFDLFCLLICVLHQLLSTCMFTVCFFEKMMQTLGKKRVTVWFLELGRAEWTFSISGSGLLQTHLPHSRCIRSKHCIPLFLKKNSPVFKISVFAKQHMPLLLTSWFVLYFLFTLPIGFHVINWIQPLSSQYICLNAAVSIRSLEVTILPS